MFQDDLTRRDWDALKEIARGFAAQGSAGSPASKGPDPALLDRLVGLDMAADENGAIRLTDLGRRAVLRGSPALWSLCA